MDFTFVHAADLHLDTPFKGLVGKLPFSAREVTFRAFARIVDVCLQERAEVLVLAGDLFDAKDRSVRARLFLRQELMRLDAAGVRTFIVHGNHDPLSGDTGNLKWPASVKVFGSAWEEVAVERKGQVVCRVQGMSYPQEAVRDNLARHFARQGPEFTIGLLHTNVGACGEHPNYAPCSWEDLEDAALDYWALGHVHTRQERRLPGGGWAVYPGNPQGRHVAETGERGCVVVRVAGGKAQVRFAALDVLRWHRMAVDLSDTPTLDALCTQIEMACKDLGQGVDGHVVKVDLSGRGPLHAELAGQGAQGLEEHLKNALAALRPPVFLESVDDATRAELDWESLRQGGLTGALSAAAGDPSVLGEVWADPELKRLHQALAAAGIPSPKNEGSELLCDAADRVVEALVGADGA